MDFVKQALAGLFVTLSLGTCVAESPLYLSLPMDQQSTMNDNAATANPDNAEQPPADAGGGA